MDRVAFFADERLSENIDVTPEGYLICRNAVIGRSGFQTYKVGEIADPEGLLEAEQQRLSPEDKIDLWRDPKEVFSPATMASFEGKTFTFTHPDNLLDPDNERYHHAGHVQNVRRGEPLDTGDIPLLADIIVTERGAIDSIKGGERELSCGYTYKLVKTGNRWDQTDIIGNHVALVQKGRAGSEARIYDADPQAGATSAPPAAGHPAPTFPANHVPAIRVPKTGSLCNSCKFVSLDMLHCASADYVKWNNGSPELLYPADEFCSDWYEPKAGLIAEDRQPAKDSWWKEKPMSLIQRIFGMGMKEFAKDAKPEELAEAIRDHTLAIDEKKEDTTMHNGNGHSNGHRKLVRIGVLRDGTAVWDEAGNPGSSAKTPEAAGTGPVSGTGNDDDDDRRGKDEGEERAAMDRRKKMHDLLDEMLNKSESSKATQASEHDANVNALKELMGEYLGEEAGEKQHTDALPPEFTKKAGDAEEEQADDVEEEADDDDDDKKGKDDDDDDRKGRDDDDDDKKGKDAEIVRAEPELEESQTPKNPVGDRVVFDAKATMILLKAFRPIVASSKDRRVRAAFDTLFQGLRKAAKRGGTGKDSYARVIRASGKLADDKVQARDSKDGAPKRRESEIQRSVRENDEMYALFMQKNRGLSAQVLEKSRNK
jgi:hypothetical protein